MHSVERIRFLLDAAKEQGWVVREEWLSGAGCSVCELRGARVLFVDLSLPTSEVLSQLEEICRDAAVVPMGNAVAYEPAAYRQRKTA
ncbi:MAG: hypothetical protein D6741_04995 [Planctomycetota bacterium]|nr:MAG: hypothetical protein D6741_04995 [Planctomycetota bacterium]